MLTLYGMNVDLLCCPSFKQVHLMDTYEHIDIAGQLLTHMLQAPL